MSITMKLNLLESRWQSILLFVEILRKEVAQSEIGKAYPIDQSIICQRTWILRV